MTHRLSMPPRTRRTPAPPARVIGPFPTSTARWSSGLLPRCPDRVNPASLRKSSLSVYGHFASRTRLLWRTASLEAVVAVTREGERRPAVSGASAASESVSAACALDWSMALIAPPGEIPDSSIRPIVAVRRGFTAGGGAVPVGSGSSLGDTSISSGCQAAVRLPAASRSRPSPSTLPPQGALQRFGNGVRWSITSPRRGPLAGARRLSGPLRPRGGSTG